MGRIVTTGGDIIFTIPNCGCGSAGGCENCRPIILSVRPKVIYTFIKPSPYEEYIFYRKAEIDAHPEWGIKYLWEGKWQ